MQPAPSTPLRIALAGAASVSALAMRPTRCTAALVLAHGAGAGMQHPFMEALATALAAQGIATLRFQFPFMETGSRRPDAPAVAQAAVRAAVAQAQALWPELPLFCGGKSFGARMGSQAQAQQPLVGVHGLVFFGFPLHPAGKPGTQRADHLAAVHLPMLFLQGTRDALAQQDLMRQVARRLGPLATLQETEGADHAFHVPVRSGRTDAQVLEGLAAQAARWMQALTPA
ncbi:alpha/beta family hydrolase [Ramlibacter rhizophilus]|uniref:Alpha/beta hydrolase n=1 Tax=Ramlibacter rhizophilus TaxID=1781167 RepID=A0A4Z0BF62_9BURK|nr:alpha/beta family hydrolase [Ramlibacter rhizophilus]TFY97460.1 alpha/beta hydrolase [Ramlibacter rhizophilus]